MKIYLAHNFVARDWLKTLIGEFSKLGHEITSNWITDDSHCITGQALHSATVDLEDIERADCLVLFTDQYGDRHGRGKFVELGYAIRAGKRVFLVGEDQTSSVFYHLPTIRHCKTVEELLAAL